MTAPHDPLTTWAEGAQAAAEARRIERRHRAVAATFAKVMGRPADDVAELAAWVEAVTGRPLDVAEVEP